MSDFNRYVGDEIERNGTAVSDVSSNDNSLPLSEQVTLPLPSAFGHTAVDTPSEECTEPAPPTTSALNVETICDQAPGTQTIIGYTANLWKYLPVPENEPEPSPEYMSECAELPGSRVIAARVRGRKHKHEGANCDDWFEINSLGDITLAAVADGAGSKKFSRIGAKESCKAAVAHLTSALKELFENDSQIKSNLSLPLSDVKGMKACGALAGVVQQSAIKAYDAVEAAFRLRKSNPEYEKLLGRELELNDLSSTLLITVIIPIDSITGESLAVSCQIGDGMTAVLNSKGAFESSLKLLGAANRGEFSGETDFLTSPNITSIDALCCRTMVYKGVFDTVMMMSDGVAEDYFPNQTEMRRLYFDLIANDILESPDKGALKQPLTPEQEDLMARIPQPLAYPWVNDPSVSVPINYTSCIMHSVELTAETVWSDPTVLDLARLRLRQSENYNIGQGERLKVWLDNYVEKGSFDDRTLVVISM